METNRTTILFAFIAAAITILYYGPFIDNFFVFDDFRMIENQFRGIRAILLGYDTTRVVGNLTWPPLYFLSGFNPLGYNIFSIALHFVNALLLYFLLNRLFKNVTFSFLASLIFVSSGVGSDAVFWKITNATLLSLALCLITFHLYIKWRHESQRKYFLWSLLTFALAMFSKEDAATLPILIVLFEIIFMNGMENKAALLRRVVPYVLIVIIYLLTGQVLTKVFGVYLEIMTRFLKFRPLYSLLGGFTVFFLNPEGYLDFWNPFIYVTAVLILLSFLFVKERRLLWFGYLWILISFLPSSLTALGRFDPVYIFNSISRFLYMPSAGSSIVAAIILISFRERFSNKVFVAACALFFVIFIPINYARVQDRGKQWQRQGPPIERFLYSLKKMQPTFPENSYVHVVNGPTGRAYIQQSLRAFYGNPKIYWVDDPTKVALKNGDSLFVIFHNIAAGKVENVWKAK